MELISYIRATLYYFLPMNTRNTADGLHLPMLEILFRIGIKAELIAKLSASIGAWASNPHFSEIATQVHDFTFFYEFKKTVLCRKANGYTCLVDELWLVH